MTMIARTIDGLPLVGTMQENEEVSETSSDFSSSINSTFISSSVGQERAGVSKSG